MILGFFIAIVSISSFSFGSQAYAADANPITGLAGKCLDVRGGKAFARNVVQLYSCNNTAAQQWEQPGDGTVRNQGFCLDVQWGNQAPKTLVWLYDCNGSQAQQWKINNDGSLVSLRSNLCLDDQYGGTNDRNPIWTYTCNTTSSQKWTVVVPTTIVPASSTATTPAAPAQTGEGYTNVDGNHINSPSSNPEGATAQCVDGSYSYSQHRSGTCSHHGGVAVWL